MNKKFLLIIWYCISIIFLVIALVYQTILNDNFNIKTFLNTDGLAIIGILITLVNLIVMKIPWIRNAVFSTMSKFSSKKYSYDFLMTFNNNGNAKIESVENCIKTTLEFLSREENTIRALYDTPVKKTFSYKKIANIEIVSRDKKIFLKIDGNAKYKDFFKLVSLFMNRIHDELNQSDIIFEKISLNILGEKKLLENFNAILYEHYLIEEATLVSIDFDLVNNSNISLNTESGIAIGSTNRSDFLTSLTKIKAIIIV